MSHCLFDDRTFNELVLVAVNRNRSVRSLVRVDTDHYQVHACAFLVVGNRDGHS
jgi:hypothetical protein